MERSEVATYAVMLRPMQGPIHTLHVQASAAFQARQMALALYPDQMVIRVYVVSYRDS